MFIRDRVALTLSLTLLLLLALVFLELALLPLRLQAKPLLALSPIGQRLLLLKLTPAQQVQALALGLQALGLETLGLTLSCSSSDCGLLLLELLSCPLDFLQRLPAECILTLRHLQLEAT